MTPIGLGRDAGIGIEAIDHVGLAVPDLDQAIAFHTDALGLVLRHREENTDQGIAEAMMAPPDAAPDTGEIQLIASLREDSAITRFLDRSGPGQQHLAYRVSDVEAAAQSLRDRGVRLLYPTARRGTRGSKINFVHPEDAGGVLVELVQRTD